MNTNDLDPMLTVGEVGEKRLIRDHIRPLAQKTGRTNSIWDDCATISAGVDNITITTDKIPEDLVAWKYGLMDSVALGRYLVEVNASDICSMGCQPKYLLVNVALPRNFSASEFIKIYSGISKRCRELGISIVGGDTKFASSLSLVGIAVGYGASGNFHRYTAGPSELVFVTGKVGGFGAALRLIVNNKWDSRKLDENTQRSLYNSIVSPICEARLVDALVHTGLVTSCMDISDGLGQSLLELAGASNVGISINGDSIPLSTGVVEASEILGCSWPEIVMGPGLDLKLLGTMADCDASRNACDQLGISIIGRTTTDRNLKWISRDNVSMKIEGYDQLKDDLLISLKN